MGILSGFGLLVLGSVTIAVIYTLFEKHQERRLIQKGLIAPYQGYNEMHFKQLKDDGYKSIAIQRIRRGDSSGKIALKDAIKLYEQL
ncbi:MAG: hypothetical protein CSA49_03485 [Gammaproteobacteria bacterium]|nr:MAG: hypothetical protein CSA49_03485 [Gammaproteobacteria bacterium]